MLKIKYGNSKKNETMTKKEFQTLDQSRRLLTNLFNDHNINSGLKDNLHALIRDLKAKNKTSIQTEMPVTFYREIKGLGTFEFTGVKNKENGVVSVFKSANEKIKKDIKKARSDRKVIKPYSDTFTDKESETHPIMKVGPGAVRNIIDKATGKKIDEVSINTGVFAEPRTILRIMNWKYCKPIFNDKKPDDNNKYVGIELEFFCDVDKKVLAYNFYEKNLIQYLSLTDDGSIKGYPAGKHAHELRILCKEQEVEKVVKEVCEILNKYNAQVNKSCGTHVHLDMRHRDTKKVFKNLYKAQKILYMMNPKARKNTAGFSVPLSSDNLDEALNRDDGGARARYYGINAKALKKHKTFEIRIHAGMVDYQKIINWVKLLIHIVSIDHSVDEYKKVADFHREFNIPEELQKYVDKRIELTKEGELDIEESA